MVRAGKFEATTDFAESARCDALIICVPTPLTKHHEPDLRFVRETRDSLMPHLRAGQVISLESTTYPGTTDEELAEVIEKERGLKVGEDIFVVYSPEREDPGNSDFTGKTIPKVLGGTTPACLRAGLELYGAVFEKTVPVSSTRVAEFTKLLENIYRAVNIGLVNEMKLVADRMGLDIWEVIDAAASKPFGFTPFYPGPGLGGHCIPIDPFYLTWKAREYGVHTRFIELAGEINEGMPEYVVRRTAEVLNLHQKPLNGSRVLILGLAYKPDVDDMRESPSLRLMELLAAAGTEVAYHDPHIPEIRQNREHPEFVGWKSVEWSRERIARFDAVILATAHRCFHLEELADWARCLIDTRNALRDIPISQGKLFKS
jgi:UDP-N-acetyl-D-glucosamine dehydrogenase